MAGELGEGRILSETNFQSYSDLVLSTLLLLSAVRGPECPTRQNTREGKHVEQA